MPSEQVVDYHAQTTCEKALLAIMASFTTIKHTAPLNGTNYPLWAVECEEALRSQGLFGVITDPDNERWMDVDKARARLQMTTNLSTDARMMLASDATPQGIWNSLKAEYIDQGIMGLLPLQQIFSALALGPTETTDHHARHPD